MVESILPKNEFDALCNEILSLIEINETRLLNWGFLDVQVDLKNELPALLHNLPVVTNMEWEKAQTSGIKIEDILDNLTQRKLILTDGKYYRSRFAEAIRLFYLLRQRFSEKDWQTASRLVSDIRIQGATLTACIVLPLLHIFVVGRLF